MDRLNELIRLYEPCNVLLCAICSRGIRPGEGAISHFRKHHRLTGEKLQQVAAFVTSKPHAANPTTVDLPQDGSAPIDGLPRLKGYSCTDCRYLTISRDKVVAHRRIEGHTAIEGPGWTEVALQSFGRWKHARYWVVQAYEEEGSSSGRSGVFDGLAQSLQACEDMLGKEAEERWRTIEEESNTANTSRWVRHMRWKKHLRGTDRKKLREAASGVLTVAEERKLYDRTRVADNQRLRLLADSFERELRRSARRIDRVPTQTLKWLQSVDPTKPVGEPFDVKEKDKTWDFYCSRFQRYLCYCVRAWSLGRRGARREHRVRFTDKQWEGLGAMVQRLDVVAEKQGTGQAGGPATGKDEQDPDEAALDRAVFAFCVDSLQQKVRRRVYDNPLLHFTAVMAIGVTKKLWMPAHSFTRCLAGILWCSRVLLLEHAFAPYGRPEGDSDDEDDDSITLDGDGNENGDGNGDDGRGGNSSDTEDDDEEVAREAIDNFARIHREWLCDGQYAPISTVIEWMAYGRGFRRRELGTPRLAWEQAGKSFNFEGERIRLADFRVAVRAIVDEAEMLLDGLLEGQWAQIRPTIELGDIVDSLVYEGPGRSFATNGKNRWLRPGAGRMAELVGRRLFRAVETEGGRVVYECRRQATEEYILGLKRFKGAILTAIHIWAGQPGRGPEMLTLKHCDTEELPRNAFVFDGLMLLITDHDKQRQGRRVARWLPVDVSRMLVAYIAWLVPFEQVLHRLSGIRGPADTLHPWLWKDASKNLWNTEDLSRRLDILTSTHMGVRLTTASYRHVAIELGRQIKGLVIAQAEMDATNGGQECEEWIDPHTGEVREQPMLDYIWDLQATHRSQIAASHYAISVMHPDQLQPELLMKYKLISELWHGYLRGGGEGQVGRKRGVPEGPEGPPTKRARTTQGHRGGMVGSNGTRQPTLVLTRTRWHRRNGRKREGR